VPAPRSPLRVLLVEDDDAYAALVAAELLAHGDIAVVSRVSTVAASTAALAGRAFDAVLLDLGLPDSEGVHTVQRMHTAAGGVPIVVLTSRDDDGAALESMHHGAEDYLVKSQVDGPALLRSIRHARERAALRRTLVEREARFRALVENSYDGITLLDQDFTALYRSRSTERSCGYAPEELVGRRIDVLLHPDDRPRVAARIAECLAAPGLPVALDYRFQHKDGSWRWGEAVCVNRLAEPEVRAIVVNHRDISERKAAEEALGVSEAALRQAHKMEAIGRLAGGVAHDFNNVLTAIFGYTDLLLEQFPEGDERRQDLQEIRKSAERAAALTRQLLAFSRKQVMRPAVIDLNFTIANIERLLVRLVGEDVEVSIEPGPDLWTVMADSGQIEQVLMNLAANARDAMIEGGRLTIGTRNVSIAAGGLPRRPGLHAGDYALLEVADTGGGIPEEVRAQIFEPFFTTKAEGKGTGLGLATVYGIVKQSGGGIYVDSEVGEGTRFSIYLPRTPSATLSSSV
jgi:PAS domain S-box-containing protein